MGARTIGCTYRRLRSVEGRPRVALVSSAGAARAGDQPARGVLEPRHAADQRALHQCHAGQSLRHREKSQASGAVGVSGSIGNRGLADVRCEHGVTWCRWRHRIRTHCRAHDLEVPHFRTAHTARARSAHLSVGRHHAVAAGVARKNRARG